MTFFWYRDRHDNDPDFNFDVDVDVDQWVKSALDAERAQMDADFDFEAGLDDIYARAGLTRPKADHPRSHAATERSTDDIGGQGALRVVIDHIEMLDALLATVTKSDPDTSPLLGVIYLKTARQYLLQLRLGLSRRHLTHTQAAQLVEVIKHDLKETDTILRTQQGLSLQEAIHARIGELRDVGGDLIEQVQRLHEQVLRLFTDVDEPAPRFPVPQH